MIPRPKTGGGVTAVSMDGDGKGGVFKPTTFYPQISGFWTWDIKRNLVFGDANLCEYFGLADECLTHGAPVDRYIEGVVPEDRERVAAAIQLAVENRSSFKQYYSVKTKTLGTRRVLAMGRCYADESGEPANFPGWFTDVTDPERFQGNALKLAAAYAEHSKDMAMTAGECKATYLLDAAILEMRRRMKGYPNPIAIKHGSR